MKSVVEARIAPSDQMRAASADWRDAFTPRRFLLLTAALIAVAYPKVILGLESFFNNDFGQFTYPVAYYTHESIWRHEIPLWNPLSNCGIPFLSQWNTTVCYPLSWFYILLPLPWSLNIFCLAHLVLAAFGMYLLAHRWTGNRFAASVAGIAFGFNGLAFNCLMWTSNLAALSWMPLVVLSVERAWREGGRRIVIAAFAAAIQVLAGAPEIIFLTWLLFGMLWLGQAWHHLRTSRGEEALTQKSEVRSQRSELGSEFPANFGRYGARVGIVVLLVCGLAAVQILPFLQLLIHSSRESGTQNSAWAMPLWGWANIIVPLFRCLPSIIGPYYQLEQQWTSSYYSGIGVLALGLVATLAVRDSRVRWLATVALLGVILAMGDNGLLYRVLKHTPLVGLARYPIKFIVLTIFALPLLAAFGINRLVTRPAARNTLRPPPFPNGEGQSEGSRLGAVAYVMLSSAFLLFLLIGILIFSNLSPYRGESWPITLQNGITRAGFLILTVATIFFLVKSSVPSRRRWIALSVLLLLAADTLTHMPPQNPAVTTQVYGPISAGISLPPHLGDSRAMISPQAQGILSQAATSNKVAYCLGNRTALSGNNNLLDDIPKVNGFFSLHLREEAQVQALLYSSSILPGGLADFLGVSQISAPDELFKWVPRTNSLPWITAGQKPVFTNSSETLTALADAQFDPRHLVYLPTEARAEVSITNSTSTQLTSLRFSPQKISFKVQTTEPAIVVIAQSFYQPWRADVDGHPTKLFRANHAFQGFVAPAGEHEIRLVYRDIAFYIGAALSTITLLLCLVLLKPGIPSTLEVGRPTGRS